MILPPTCILALSPQVPACYSLPQWLPVSLPEPAKSSLLSLPLLLSFPFIALSTPATRLSMQVSPCPSLFENPQSFPVTNRVESKEPSQSDPEYHHINTTALMVSSPPPSLSLCLYSRHGFPAAPKQAELLYVSLPCWSLCFQGCFPPDISGKLNPPFQIQLWCHLFCGNHHPSSSRQC